MGESSMSRMTDEEYLHIANQVYGTNGIYAKDLGMHPVAFQLEAEGRGDFAWIDVVSGKVVMESDGVRSDDGITAFSRRSVGARPV